MRHEFLLCLNVSSAIVAPNSDIINTASYPTHRPNILPGTRLLVSAERSRLLNVGANKVSKGRPGWKRDAKAQPAASA